MSHRIGIAVVVALCACSIDDPGADPAATEQPGATEPGAPEPVPSPDGESLPAAARLIPEPVDSVADLPGTYAQPFALAGQVSTIHLAPPNLATGHYELFRSCGVPNCVKESGQYHVVPTNPAIGFAALSLVDQTGTVRATYILDLLWRDADGALVAVQLRALIGNVTGPTQVWWRLPDDDADPDEPDPTVLAAPASGNGAATLAGVFVRPLPVYGDIGALTLSDAVWTQNAATGTYEASFPYCLPWCFPETGTYVLELDSVATGTGRLQLIPTGNETAAHDYVVYATWRAADNRATAIQLQRVDGVVPSGPPFVVYRQWWNANTAAPSESTSSCSYLLGLVQYYRTRALQCGMSACYPLEPYYRSWLAYYESLAAAAGCQLDAP